MDKSNRQPQLAVLIWAHNDEKNIQAAIASARLLTSAIYVVDIGSTDSTAKLAEAAGARIIAVAYSPYVEPTRLLGIEAAPAKWVLIMDSDERLTDALSHEIKSSLPKNMHTHYKIPRKNMFAGKIWLRYGGWWPDNQTRLIKKVALLDWPKEIHSTPKVQGKEGHLKNPLIHLVHGDIEKMVEKTLIFEGIESELLFEANKPVSTTTFFRKFWGELARRLVINTGFLDGTIGIIEGIYQAYSKTITYLMLYEKKKLHAKKSS